MKFREITEEDVSSIFDVRVRTLDTPNGKEDLERMGITPHFVRERMKTCLKGWLCEVEREVIGFAMGNMETGEMWVIAVLKEFEGRGIGGRLLTRVEECLAAEGQKESWLTTYPTDETRAIRFYEHQGWEKWKIEDEDLYMRKRIGT